MCVYSSDVVFMHHFLQKLLLKHWIKFLQPAKQINFNEFCEILTLSFTQRCTTEHEHIQRNSLMKISSVSKEWEVYKDQIKMCHLINC